MVEPKDFGETRMFSPDAMYRFHRAVQNGVERPVPKPLVPKVRLVFWMLLFASAAAALIWLYRAPVSAGLTRIAHRCGVHGDVGTR